MNTITLHLSPDLYEKIAGYAKEQKKSIEDVTLEFVREGAKKFTQAYTQLDEEKVKERLKSLGYLD